jgi:hypothetical protein
MEDTNMDNDIMSLISNPPLSLSWDTIIAKSPQNITYYAKPCPSFGYYRGSPIFENDTASVDDNYGPDSQGVGEFSQGQGPAPVNGIAIPPSVVVVLAIVAVLAISTLCCR